MNQKDARYGDRERAMDTADRERRRQMEEQALRDALTKHGFAISDSTVYVSPAWKDAQVICNRVGVKCVVQHGVAPGEILVRQDGRDPRWFHFETIDV
jgi:hypothetical protein